MRILFMGTPEFAVESLRRLVADGHEGCGVITQPDKPRNRNKVTFSPVKEYALSQNLPVYQPVSVRDGEALALVERLDPELIVTAAYGKLLPEEIPALLDKGDRRLTGPTMPPQGLYLNRVWYDGTVGEMMARN